MNTEISYAYLLLAPAVCYVLLKILFATTEIQFFEDLLLVNSLLALVQIVALPPYIKANQPLQRKAKLVIAASVVAFMYSLLSWLVVALALALI